MIPMHTVLKLCGRRAGFARGVRADHVPRRGEAGGQVHCQDEKWGDDGEFPKAVHEMAFPGIEKMPIRNAFPISRASFRVRRALSP